MTPIEKSQKLQSLKSRLEANLIDANIDFNNDPCEKTIRTYTRAKMELEMFNRLVQPVKNEEEDKSEKE